MVTFDAASLDAWLAGLLLPFLRILALFTAAPIFSARAFPVRARVAAAGAMAAVAAPLVAVPPGLTLANASGLMLVAQQVVIGLALGFSVRLLFAAIELAGEIIGLQMGLSFAGFINPGSGTQSSAVSSWLNALAVLVYLSLNAHLVVIDALLGTFQTLPIAAEPLQALARVRVDQLGADVFRLALSLALPAVALMMGVNLAMGLAARMAPQMSLFAVGFPITVLAGFALLALSPGHLSAAISEALPRFLAAWR